jgi:hypothetical protein
VPVGRKLLGEGKKAGRDCLASNYRLSRRRQSITALPTTFAGRPPSMHSLVTMTDSVQLNDWDDALRHAFAILLGRPLEEFPDATYAAYYDCADLAFDFFKRGFDLGPLARGEIVRPPFPTIPQLGELLRGWDLITPHWSIDLGQSIFEATEINGGADRGVPELDAPMLGRDLGRILTERGLRPEDFSKTFPDIQFRAHTDGSLFDAMRFVTGTHRGPDHLLKARYNDWGFDASWEQKLAAIGHEGLRDALRNLCRTENAARADGAYFLGADLHFSKPRQVVAAWRFGEAQAWSWVVQLP